MSSRSVVMVITYVLSLRMGESETVDLRYHPFGTMNHSITFHPNKVNCISYRIGGNNQNVVV
jgi:hypothetical protein